MSIESQMKKDPISDALSKIVAEGRKAGDKTEKNNRFFTPDEWFAKYYQGQPDEELPVNIFGSLAPEEIRALREKYKQNDPNRSEKQPQEIQTDLFDQKYE